MSIILKLSYWGMYIDYCGGERWVLKGFGSETPQGHVLVFTFPVILFPWKSRKSYIIGENFCSFLIGHIFWIKSSHLEIVTCKPGNGRGFYCSGYLGRVKLFDSNVCDLIGVFLWPFPNLPPCHPNKWYVERFELETSCEDIRTFDQYGDLEIVTCNYVYWESYHITPTI